MGTPPPGAADVFISYQRRDAEHARALYDALISQGVSAWYDADLPAGGEWREELAQRIAACKFFVIVFSSNANASKEMKKELAVAGAGSAAIVAVRVEDARPRGAFAYELMGRNWVDAIRDRPRRFARLAAQIESTLSGKEAVSRVDPLALSNATSIVDHFFWALGGRWLVGAWLALALALFVVWNRSQGVVDALVRGGSDPLQAWLTGFAAAIVGAPLFVAQGFSQPLSGETAAVVALASAETLAMLCILIQLVRTLAALVLRGALRRSRAAA